MVLNKSIFCLCIIMLAHRMSHNRDCIINQGNCHFKVALRLTVITI